MQGDITGESELLQLLLEEPDHLDAVDVEAVVDILLHVTVVTAVHDLVVAVVLAVPDTVHRVGIQFRKCARTENNIYKYL